MIGFRSPEAAQCSPGSPNPTKTFTKRIRNRSSAFIDSVLSALERPNRRASSEESETRAELCPRCLEYVLDQSWNPVRDARLVTSLSLAFDGLCPQQEPHIAEVLGTMESLRHLELLDVRITSDFYAMLAERVQFRLEYFTCKSPPFDSLLRFLSTQRRLLEVTFLGRPLETQALTRVYGQEVLCTVQTLSTTAPLLLHPRLNAASLRHLEYIGGGQSLREEARAIKKICQFGPQLRSLRFIWNTGRAETFLDVTKFFSIAASTPSIKYMALLGINRNVSYSSSPFNVPHLRVRICFRYSSSSLRQVLETILGGSCSLFYGSQIHRTRMISTNPNRPYRPYFHLRFTPLNCRIRSGKVSPLD